MKKILILGAGMVAKPMIDYLLTNQFQLTIASRTIEKAQKLIGGRENAIAIAWTADNLDKLDELIAANDLIVSMLPYKYHVSVARHCIKNGKHMITTSYVSEEMKELDKEAKKAGVLILNEMGLDPGFDHMTAMRIIDKVHEQGGTVKEFYSLCGALAAPEETNNPFRYKFSWSPRGVVLAGNQDARFLKNGQQIEIPKEELFKNPMLIDFPEVEEMEVYPNRDSLAYIDLYHLQGIKTMFRGTFRYKNWCEIMDALKMLEMTSTEIKNFEGKTYRKVIARQLEVYPANIKEKVAERLQLEIDSPAIIAMEWLGFFSDDLVQMSEGSNLDLTTDLMLRKMMLNEGSRDMVIMLHSFLVENADGTKQVIKSRLLNFATEEDTSISRAVALPAAIAVKLILEGKIPERGIQIPVSKTIYAPVLDELAAFGITMNESWNLALSEKI